MHAVIAQLGIVQQDLPRFAGCLGFAVRGLLVSIRRARARGEQLLPVQLAIGLAGGPGFQMAAAQLADADLTPGQVQRGFAQLEPLQANQLAPVRAVEGQRGHGGLGAVQCQGQAVAEVEVVAGTQVDTAISKNQWRRVAHVRPEVLQRQFADLQLAARGQRLQVEVALPVDASAACTCGGEAGVGAAVRAGGKVVQLEVQRVVDQLDGLTWAPITEGEVSAHQLQLVDTQREEFALVVGRWLRFGDIEQLAEVQGAVLGEEHLGVRRYQLYGGQVQRALPEAVPLQVEVESLEGQLAIVLRADAQVEQGEFEAEGIEFDALQAGRYGGVVGQLLIGDALGDTRQDQEAKQAVADQHERHAGERSLHSIGHDRKYSWRMDALEYGMARRFPESSDTGNALKAAESRS